MGKLCKKVYSVEYRSNPEAAMGKWTMWTAMAQNLNGTNARLFFLFFFLITFS